MCHGPGSLKRMNPDAAPESDKERLETRIEDNRDIVEMEVIVKESLEASEEVRKKKI